MTRPSLADIALRAEARAAYEGRSDAEYDPDVATDLACASAADVLAMSAAIRDVLALHTPETPRRDPDFHHTDRVCIECGDPFPCRTYTAVTAHIDTASKDAGRG